jgi:hypothetical protein
MSRDPQGDAERKKGFFAFGDAAAPHHAQFAQSDTQHRPMLSELETALTNFRSDPSKASAFRSIINNYCKLATDEETLNLPRIIGAAPVSVHRWSEGRDLPRVSARTIIVDWIRARVPHPSSEVA